MKKIFKLIGKSILVLLLISIVLLIVGVNLHKPIGSELAAVLFGI